MNFGGQEMIIVLIVVLVLFGGKKIPEIAKGLGKGIRDFKSSLAGTDEKDESKNLSKPDAKTAQQEPGAKT